MRLHVIVILLSILLSACSQDNSLPADSALTKSETGRTCSTDADCTNDLICDQKACKTDNGHEAICPTRPTYLSGEKTAGCFAFCRSNEKIVNDPYTPRCLNNLSRILATTLISKITTENGDQIRDIVIAAPIQVPISRADRANNTLRRSIVGINYLIKGGADSPWREESLCISANSVDRGNETLADDDHEIAIEVVPINSLCCDVNQNLSENSFCKPQYRIVPEKM
jgi:hypothetical protein